MIKKSIFILGLALTFFACNSSSEDSDSIENETKEEVVESNVTISGTIRDGGNIKVALEANNGSEAERLNETITDEDGNFLLKGNIKEMGLYQFVLVEETAHRQQRGVPLTLVPEDHIQLQLMNNDELDYNAKYEGTVWAEPINGYMKEMKKYIEWQNSLSQAGNMDQDELMGLVFENKKPMDNYIIQQINEDPSNPANMLLMTNLVPVLGFDYYDESYLDVLKTMRDAYVAEYPELIATKVVENQVEGIEKGFANYNEFRANNIAPDIALPNPEGDTLRLSDLQGKYVLIDFWAAWCGPCRRENPNVVRIYKKYKDKGFEVFSVSLDKTKEDWIKAIKEDDLLWDHHVSDLKFWQSSVVGQYGFNAIPHTVLVDPEGKIVAENLRGLALENKLKEVLH